MADKIALFFGNFQGGGVQRVRLILARGFIAQGLGVDLVVVKGEGELRKQVPDGVSIVDLGSKRTLMALPALVGYLQSAQPKAILSSQTHHNILAIIARWLSGVSTRLVVGEHHNIQEHRKDAPLTANLHLLGARLFYPCADAVLAVSKGVADALSATSGIQRELIHVIYNPIIFADLQEKSEADPDHTWLDQHDCPVLVAIGRLSKEKDFPTLLEALTIIKKTRQVRLIILGEGECRAELSSLIQEYKLEQDVHLPGFVENPYAYLSRADIFVLSSRWEGFPNALLEALACGIPVVSTDCPSGPAEMLANGRYGRLVTVGDAEALANAVNVTLDEPISAEFLKKRAEEFSLDIISKQYIDLLLG